MARQLEPASVTREERTFRVERETPLSGDYRLRIHREVITRDGTEILGRTERLFAYDEPATKAATRPAFAAYLAAIKSAQSGSDIIAAESALYDSLVAEVDAEREEAASEQRAKAEAAAKASKP
jgi:hypothetical protein